MISTHHTRETSGVDTKQQRENTPIFYHAGCHFPSLSKKIKKIRARRPFFFSFCNLHGDAFFFFFACLRRYGNVLVPLSTEKSEREARFCLRCGKKKIPSRPQKKSKTYITSLLRTWDTFHSQDEEKSKRYDMI